MLEKEKLIDKRIGEMEIECREEGNAKNYIKDTLSKFWYETTGQVAQRLYNELSDRYDTSLWLVVVYATLHNPTNHAFNKITVRTHYVMDAGGKNAVAYAFSHSDVAANQNLCRSKVAAYEKRVNELRKKDMFVYCEDSGFNYDCLYSKAYRWLAHRADFVVEVLTKHYDSERRIKDDDVVVVAIEAKDKLQNQEKLLGKSTCNHIYFYWNRKISIGVYIAIISFDLFLPF